MDTSRMTGHQIQQHQNKIRIKEQQLSKEQFEQDLRESNNKETASVSGLFGASTNPFETKLNKDVQKTLTMNERKRKMQIDMASMINDLSEKDFTRFEETMQNFEIVKK